MVTLNLRDDCNGRVATNFKRGMTDKRFLELEITAWLTSPERKKQLEGEAYYDGYQDVTHRERLALDEDGKPTPVPPLICQTDEDRMEYEAAKRRSALRKERRKEEY